MKKNKINSEDFDLREEVIGGYCQPKGDLMTKNMVYDDCLELQVDDVIGNLEKSYMLVWNKQLSKVVAIQEIDILDGNVISAHLKPDFLFDLKNATSFKYGRICLALQWEDEYAIVYVKSSDQRGNYIGYFQGVVFYYSEADLLSVKCMTQSEYYREMIRVTITEIKVSDSYIHFSAVIHSLNPEDVSWDIVSKTNGLPMDDIELSVSREEGPDQAQVVTVSVDFSNITPDNYDAFDVSAFYGEYKLKVALSQECEDDASVWSKTCPFGSSMPCEFCLCESKDGQLEIQIAEKVYRYMFSIVMAVYNTGQFLAEALESLLVQNEGKLESYIIGNKSGHYWNRFYREIYEVILVDDGSTDGSGKICDEYAAAYKNIKVVHKENGGVSSARNEGIQIAMGKYINFMDSDDTFSNNVLASTFLFFEQHYDEVDIVAFPMKFFDKQEGDHWLNEKFSDGSRVIDLWKEYDKSLVSVSSSLFKTETVQNKIWFDTSLITGEDIKFIYTILFSENARIGLVNQCVYWYRRRKSGEASAIQSSRLKEAFYTTNLSDLMDWLALTSEKQYGFIPCFVQSLMAQQLQFRYKEDADANIATSVLNKKEFKAYKEHLSRLWKYIDIQIILEQKKIYREHKMYILQNKYGDIATRVFANNDIYYFYDRIRIAEASTCYVRLEFLKIDNHEFILEGYNMSFEKDTEFYIKLNDDFILIHPLARDKNVYSLGDAIFFSTDFQYNFTLDESVNEYEIEFFEKIEEHYIQKKVIRFSKTMPLTKTYTRSYYMKDGWCITQKSNRLKIENLISSYEKLTTSYRYEEKFEEEIERKCKNNQITESRKEIMAVVANYSLLPHKKIWLISDRANMAGDNGEALFLYLMQKQDPEIEVYFVINKDCSDYKHMQKFGKVVVQGSKEHRILHVMADCIISSHADEYVIDPFYYEHTSEIFRDLMANKNFVFLQHGITINDVSNWLNRYKKNITGFITSARPERQSILEYNYFYSENEVWLTGFPRHDRLYHDEKNYVTIMPTWRRYLSEPSENDPKIRTIIDKFTSSNFFEFYNLLLNDERLLSAADKAGYTICFMPHPTLMNNLDKFDHDPRVKFFGKEKPYREIFAESNLVMTDYSSSVMDFAYLRKPVVYCQFDQSEFYAGDHVCVKGYFDYERDGFGEVTYDLKQLVSILIEYMQNGCKLKQIYKERINKFFAFDDKNNCERVYRKLKEL